MRTAVRILSNRQAPTSVASSLETLIDTFVSLCRARWLPVNPQVSQGLKGVNSPEGCQLTERHRHCSQLIVFFAQMAILSVEHIFSPISGVYYHLLISIYSRKSATGTWSRRSLANVRESDGASDCLRQILQLVVESEAIARGAMSPST